MDVVVAVVCSHFWATANVGSDGLCSHTWGSSIIFFCALIALNLSAAHPLMRPSKVLFKLLLENDLWWFNGKE